MQYQVPQFIEVEDKIFGPLTLKQFIYVAGSVGIIVIIFFSPLPTFVAVLASIPFAALGGALAFVKINEKPFIEVLESGFFFLTGSKLYLWNKKGASVAKKEEAVQKPAPKQQTPQAPPQEAMQKIRSLAFSLDIKDQNNNQYGG